MPGAASLAVVGATGVVGTVICELLSSRKNVWSGIRLADPTPDPGRTVLVRGQELPVEPLCAELFDGIDVAMFDVADDLARDWARIATSRGVVVIDNSTAFRADPDVPVIVPEINGEAVRRRPRGVLASPTSASAVLVVTVGALDEEYGLRELIVASYEAASAVGQSGVDTLAEQVSRVSGNRALGSRAGNVRQAIGDEVGPFPAPLALNVVPWIGAPSPDGWSTQERAVHDELRRILDRPDLKVSVTCVQVPVVTGHSLAVHAVFRSDVDAEGAREVLRSSPGVIVVDDPEAGEYPMPVDAVGTDPVWVGRIRRSLDDPCALDLFLTGDNLRKGSALNMVQIGELIAREFRG